MKKNIFFGFIVLSMLLVGCSPSIDNTNNDDIKEEHVHTYSGKWSYDDTYHWRTATCEHVDLIIDKEEHIFSDWLIDVEPTEDEPGLKHKTCNLCGYIVNDTIDKLVHSHVPSESEERNRIDPTCIEDGSYDLVTYCLNCHEILSSEHHVIPKQGHDLVHHDKKDPTCEEDGYLEYDTCTRCDYSTYIAIPATGHNHLATREENFIEPTCTSLGSKDIVTYCLDDNVVINRETIYIPTLGHDLTYFPGKEATCTEDGYAPYEMCRRCNYSTYQAIPATGHINIATREEITKEATCELEGSYELITYCKDDGVIISKESKIIPAGHNMVILPYKAATCTEDGYTEHQRCSKCGYETPFDVIPATGHRHFDGRIEDRIEPTCIEDGSYVLVTYCADDNFVVDRSNKTIPALGHDLIHHDGKAATCTTDGYLEYDTCSRCDYSTYQAIPKTGHQNIISEQRNKVEPTCLASGSYDLVTYCKDDNVIISSEHIDLPALGHDIIHHDSVPATCTEDGKSSYETCSRCDYQTDINIIPKTGHINIATREDNKINPTCTNDGSYDLVTYCKDDNVIIGSEHKVISSLGHDYQKTSHPATYESNGYDEYICSRCLDSYIEITDSQLIHQYSNEWSYDDNYHYHSCIDIGYEDIKIDQQGHDYDIVHQQVQTYFKDGIDVLTCNICGYSKEVTYPKEDYGYPNPFTFTLNDCSSGYIVSGYFDEEVTDTLIVPGYHNGLPVTEIGRLVFKENDNNTVKMSIPDSIIKISDDLPVNKFTTSYNDKYTYLGNDTHKYLWLIDSKKTTGEMYYLDIRESCQHIYNRALKNGLETEVVIPENVKTIGKDPFYTNIQKLNILGNATFDGGIKTLDLYKSLNNIYVSFSESNEHYLIDDYGVYNQNKEILYTLVANNISTLSITVPNGVKRIDDYAFESFSVWADDKIPIILNNDLTELGEGAFKSYYIKSIQYKGTVDEFASIIKDDLWCKGCPVDIITCSDGTYNVHEANEYVTSKEIGRYEYGEEEGRCIRCGKTISRTTTTYQILTQEMTYADLYDYSGELKYSLTVGSYPFNDWGEIVDNCPKEIVLDYDYEYPFYEIYLYGSFESLYIDEEISNLTIGLAPKLVNIEVDENNPNYKVVNGVLYNHDLTTLIRCPIDKEDTFIIPDSVTTIADGAFYNCSKLTSIVIPDSVATITNSSSIGVFCGCSSLETISFPDDIILERPSALFRGCSSLTSIDLSSVIISCNTISPYMFQDCSSLTNVDIPNGINAIEWNAFDGCDKLESVNIPNTVTSISSFAFYNCSSLVNVSLPNSLINLGESAFEGCTSLTSIVIPGTVIFADPSLGATSENSGRGAFNYCTSLEEITFAEGVTSVPSIFVAYCSNLKTINLSNTITHIDERAFDSTSITVIDIPHSVTSIHYTALIVNGLVTINYDGTMEEWNQIFVPPQSETFNFVVICSDGNITF